MTAASKSRAGTPALEDFIILNEEIAALVRARIPLESNLSRVGSQLPGKAGELAKRIGRRLEAGENLVDAIDHECSRMPPIYRAVIIAGIESGQLAGALEAVVESAARIDRLRRVMSVAIIYPLILAILVCVLVTVVVKLVAPGYSWLEHSAFRSFEWLSRSQYTVPVLALGIPCALVCLTLVWWWRSGRLRNAASVGTGLLSIFTGARRVYRWSEAARFAELLRLLVERGMPLDRCLELTSASTHDRRLRHASERLAADIRSGQVQRHRTDRDNALYAGFPVLIRMALLHAAERPLLVAGLRQAATMYSERTNRAADWYADYLPVLLTVAIGGSCTIGFTLFVLWPYIAALYELSGPTWK